MLDFGWVVGLGAQIVVPLLHHIFGALGSGFGGFGGW